MFRISQYLREVALAEQSGQWPAASRRGSEGSFVKIPVPVTEPLVERAGRDELRHQAGIPRRVRSHPDRDRGDHHQQGCDEDGVGKTLPAHSQRSP